MSDETHSFIVKDGGVHDFRAQTALWRLIFNLQSRGYCVMRVAWPGGGHVIAVTRLQGADIKAEAVDGSINTIMREPERVSEEEPYTGASDELRALRAVVARVEPELLLAQSEMDE